MLASLATALAVLAPQDAAAQAGAAVSAAALERIRTRCQAALLEHHAAGRFPGASAALVLPDGTLLELVAGKVHEDAEAPMTVAARLLSGSVGKTYVSACALHLVHAGALELDARIAPRFADDAWFARVPNAEDLTLRPFLRAD
jgi:D-alanyl-D-alanine carboxypeptidase